MIVEWNAEHIRTMKTSALLACLGDPANTFLADLNALSDDLSRNPDEIVALMQERVGVVIPLINAEIDRRIPVPA